MVRPNPTQSCNCFYDSTTTLWRLRSQFLFFVVKISSFFQLSLVSGNVVGRQVTVVGGSQEEEEKEAEEKEEKEEEEEEEEDRTSTTTRVHPQVTVHTRRVRSARL